MFGRPSWDLFVFLRFVGNDDSAFMIPVNQETFGTFCAFSRAELVID